MKKIVVVLLIVLATFSLHGCSVSISYYEGEYHDKVWLTNEETIEKICVPNAETAISIAELILEDYQMQGSYRGYYIRSVMYDPIEGVYIVSSWPDKGDSYMGLTLSMAIDEKDAQVLGIWIRE